MGKQGVFSTFAAFLEMCCSEITMARLNKCNVFSHFSHSGVDDMADNTCHFGINNMFADNGLEDDSGHQTRLYFPADVLQAEKVVQTVFFQPGLRFVFTTRSKTPQLLKPDGSAHYGEGYDSESVQAKVKSMLSKQVSPMYESLHAKAIPFDMPMSLIGG